MLGDVPILAGSTLCGGEPEGHLTVTTVYLDPDSMIDQVFWQYVAVLSDRLHAQQFAETVCTEPAQVVRLGEVRAGMLMPWLDELVALSIDGPAPERFYRMQALLFTVVDVGSWWTDVRAMIGTNIRSALVGGCLGSCPAAGVMPLRSVLIGEPDTTTGCLVLPVSARRRHGVAAAAAPRERGRRRAAPSPGTVRVRPRPWRWRRSTSRCWR